LIMPALAMAGVWPENVGEWRRISVQPAAVTDRTLWNEYGFREAETARFEVGGKDFTATAWRLEDSTGAMGAFLWQRPADAKSSTLADFAAETGNGVLLASGNYMVAIQGYQPTPEEVAVMLDHLPRIYKAPIPELPGYMPAGKVAPNSERYIVGPAALARFEPRVPPSVAGFHLGVEASLATFRSDRGDYQLALFNYPTHQLAMQQYEAFSKLPGAMAKRSGPLVAVVFSPPDPDAAEHLLSLVRYQAAVTMSEYVPTLRDNPAHMLLTIFALVGVLMALALVFSLGFGGIRVLLRRGSTKEPDPMIMLHLNDRK
jgi:hypothetical protein